MKPILKLIIFLAVFCVAHTASAQEEKYPETVLIKIYETYVGFAANKLETRIVTIDPDHVMTQIPLEPSMSLNDNNKEHDQNQLKIHQEFQKWHNKGFQVKTLSSVSPFDGLVVTVAVLQKN